MQCLRSIDFNSACHIVERNLSIFEAGALGNEASVCDWYMKVLELYAMAIVSFEAATSGGGVEGTYVPVSQWIDDIRVPQPSTIKILHVAQQWRVIGSGCTKFSVSDDVTNSVKHRLCTAMTSALCNGWAEGFSTALLAWKVLLCHLRLVDILTCKTYFVLEKPLQHVCITSTTSACFPHNLCSRVILTQPLNS